MSLEFSFSFCEYLDFSLMLCSLETESVCFHSLPFGFQDKIMVLPRVSSLVLYFYNTSQGHQHVQMHTTNHFSAKNKQEQDECPICVFCELYFLSYLMLKFLQIHQIPGYVARKRRQRNFQARGSALWRCRILGLCLVICLYCNSNTTIPEWVANSAEGAFPVGRKSTKTKPGSATYVINNLSLKFSR